MTRTPRKLIPPGDDGDAFSPSLTTIRIQAKIMNVLQLQYPEPEDGHLKQLLEIKEGTVHCRMGTVYLPKGARLPAEGMKANPEHEISLVMAGRIKAITKDGERIVGTGEIVQFAPGEMQAGEVLEDCQIVWVLLDR
jgi:quercetin dioxygenase-like cupin family protein